jgi:hypothetical protein
MIEFNILPWGLQGSIELGQLGYCLVGKDGQGLAKSRLNNRVDEKNRKQKLHERNQ